MSREMVGCKAKKTTRCGVNSLVGARHGSMRLSRKALVDAYGESEQVTGFYTMMENDLRLPFET